MAIITLPDSTRFDLVTPRESVDPDYRVRFGIVDWKRNQQLAVSVVGRICVYFVNGLGTERFQKNRSGLSIDFALCQ